MFGVGPIELAFFLVILLLAVGPERLPAFMRTVGKGLRQVRNASREFRDAIGLDELMREADPLRPPPVKPPRTRPVPTRDPAQQAEPSGTTPPPVPDEAKATGVPSPPLEGGNADSQPETEASGETERL